MIISNDLNKIVYFSKKSNKIIDEQEALNQAFDFNSENYINYTYNGLNTLRRPGKYNYFNGLAAIPPLTKIIIDSSGYEIIDNIPTYAIKPEYTFIDLENEIKLILEGFKGKKIGVELSGGLDSSLVIESLLKFGIEPILIGFSSDLFEFRTEKIVQNHYSNSINKSILLRYEDNFSFSNLIETPIHPIPVSESHFFQRHKTVALKAKEMGVDILFSGEAGDQILSFPVNLEPNQIIPLDFGYWCLSEHWSNQYVYENIGVQYISGMALGAIPSIILSLRNGHSWDPMKLWARNEFKHCLPPELSKFAYTAFHNGWVSKGLINASEMILHICEHAYSRYKIDALNPNKIKNQALNYSTLSEGKRKFFLSNLAFATWYYSNSNI